MMWLVSNMFLIPLRTFVYGMEMIVDAMRGLQDAGDRGIEALVGGEATAASPITESHPAAQIADSNNYSFTSGTEKLTNEEMTKMDQTLNNDMVKLVRYEILSLDRGHEELLVPSTTELVKDAIEDASYIAQKIAQWPDKTKGYQFVQVNFRKEAEFERKDLKFEEKQLDVLREIRDNIGGAAAKI
jgi:hypothetical protein